jgi:hypothetical protein
VRGEGLGGSWLLSDVDRVCINQGDLNERKYQVGLMGDIYRKAEHVVVWLGAREDDTHLAFDYFKRISNTGIKSESEEDSHYPSLTGFSSSSNDIPTTMRRRHQEADKTQFDTAAISPFVTSKELAAVFGLLRRPWWQRVWVLQEYSLARSVVFYCGDLVASERALRKGYETALAATSMTTGRKDLLDEGILAERMFSNRASMFAVRAAVRKGEYPSLSTLLWRFRSFQATDPRDKVYSLLGLLENCGSRTAITADYEISVEECYRRAAVAILLENVPSDLLNAYTDADLHGHGSFPSWVPNWNMQLKLLYIPVIRDSVPIRVLAGKEHSYQSFKASGQTIERPLIKNDFILSVSGLVIDQITELTEACTVLADLYLQLPNEDHKVRIATSRKVQLLSYLPGCLWAYYFITGCYYIGGWCDILLSWEAFALNTISPAGADPLMVFCTTLCGSYLPPEEALKHYRDLQWLLRRTRIVYRLRHLGLHKLQTPYWVIVGLALASFTYLDRHYEYQAYKNPLVTSDSLMHHRRLAKSSQGYLALVPEHTLVGDRLALLDAGLTPLVLRPRGAQCLLVGDSYVHGLMYGEGWDVTKIQNMDIV